MDPSLLKDRAAFKKRAYNNPVIENKQKHKHKQQNSSPNNAQPKKKVKKDTNGTTTLSRDPLSYARSSGSSQHNFAILAKIVNWMKQRHLDGDSEALSFDDILDETNQLDISVKQKNWLITESLPNNPKIIVTDDGKYQYKPTFALKDKKSLIRLLDRYDQRGLGGVAMDDVVESMPNAERIVKNLADNNKIIVIVRPVDKKKILYYNDHSIEYKVDEEFQKLWRCVAVEGIDEEKIEEYLQKHGLASLHDMGVKKVTPVQKRKKPVSRKGRTFKKLNDHMGDILNDYTTN